MYSGIGQKRMGMGMVRRLNGCKYRPLKIIVVSNLLAFSKRADKEVCPED